jgi:hypothetical protein
MRGRVGGIKLQDQMVSNGLTVPFFLYTYKQVQILCIGQWPVAIVYYCGRWVTKLGRWVAKLIARMLAMAALYVRIRTSLKNIKWAT